MNKVKVGNDWKIPKGFIEHQSIGGYKIGIKDDKVCIVGVTEFCISDTKIEPVTIVAMTKEQMDISLQENIKDGISTSDVFEYTEERVYFLVWYGDKRTYVFDNIMEALEMINFLVYYKATALGYKEDEIEVD